MNRKNRNKSTIDISIMNGAVRISGGLEAESCTVTSATSHSQGRQFLEQEYDTIILDIFLGERNDREFSRRLRQQNQTIAILIMPAKDSIEIHQKNQEVGINSYLQKFFAFDTLLNYMKTLRL